MGHVKRTDGSMLKRTMTYMMRKRDQKKKMKTELKKMLTGNKHMIENDRKK